MAKKKAAKKAVKKVAKNKAAAPKYVIPGDCGPFVDYLLGVMEDGDTFDLEEVRGDFQACVDFLATLPADVQPWQMDMVGVLFLQGSREVHQSVHGRTQVAHQPQRIRKAVQDIVVDGLLFE